MEKNYRLLYTQEQALPFLIDLVKTHQPQSISFLFKGSALYPYGNVDGCIDGESLNAVMVI